MESAAILGLSTAVPPHRQDQATIGRWMRAAFADEPGLARWLGLLYSAGGIDYRQSVLPELLAPPGENRWSPDRDPAASPGTGERMRLYRELAPALALSAARPLVDRLDGAVTPVTERLDRAVARPLIERPDGAEARPMTEFLDGAAAFPDGEAPLGREAITHLIVTSCTGFYAPGLDLDLAIGLGLRRDLKRTLIGFMGCAAGITGLRMAAEIVQGEPEALVLVVSAELCTLHLQPTRDREALIGASLFADGAGAALVGRPRPGMPGLFALESFATHVTPDTESEMVWTVGDHGFELRLSPQVPERVAANAPSLIAELLGGTPAFWAVHPGGKGILDKLERAAALPPEALAPSRWVLRERGNLSSATIFHVLERWAAELTAPCTGIAAAFGPGLVTELAALRWLGAPHTESDRHLAALQA